MEPTTGLRGLIDSDLAERPKSDSAGKPPADRPDTDFVDEIALLCHPITFIDESVSPERKVSNLRQQLGNSTSTTVDGKNASP